ncbi:hypothetical protein [Acidocella aminolytica]|uniref:Uncharacterized protein n=1 Tax=Acidocella aminolytica 101 = DSM 11237 TaxID=1120923 RepID=A0A0D6PDI5_9PROT|nr:hypothetical protein [Acidocella aminolytica]GAN79820.1 hypothetical protein Aam_030_053 [Acidocella aminolytica 101 = DSM 11237]GBQ34354.1 hypothetical protein AA11237_0725 [Acidocella aminolytica 101 = DSM 11237]SHF36270.1 hypothetical protein SAMN02746095_02980 [Acidocella aminolytica 101 = DSM 11237]
MALKAKKISGAELVSQISKATADLPATTPKPAQAVAEPAEPVEQQRGRGRPPKPQREKLEQVNFRCSREFCSLLLDASRDVGMRQFIATLAKKAGYDVPEFDLQPTAKSRVL